MRNAAKKRATCWQLGLALLVGAFLIAMAASLVCAALRVSRVVDSDYYSHGLQYGQTRTGTVNAGLRWAMSASLAGQDLRVRVQDETGAPVAGGKLSFEPEQGRAGEVAALALRESAPGFFRVARPRSRQDELHGTLRFTLGDASASQKLVLFN